MSPPSKPHKPLSNPYGKALSPGRKEKFAQGLVKGLSLTSAAKQAGYAPSCCASRGSVLGKDPSVIARVEELKRAVERDFTATVAVSMDWVIAGLVKNIQDAQAEKQFGVVRQCFVDIGKHLGGFRELDGKGLQYPEDIGSLDDRQRSTVMRWLSRLAYPDDPAAAEAALRIPSGTEVIEAKADSQAAENETTAAESEDAYDKASDNQTAEAAQEAESEHGGWAGDERAGNQEIRGDDVRAPRSWADLEPQERQALAAEWSARGPAMPEGLNRDERLAWLDQNWPLDQHIDW